jgi:hypothetical protein
MPTQGTCSRMKVTTSMGHLLAMAADHTSMSSCLLAQAELEADVVVEAEVVLEVEVAAPIR